MTGTCRVSSFAEDADTSVTVTKPSGRAGMNQAEFTPHEPAQRMTADSSADPVTQQWADTEFSARHGPQLSAVLDAMPANIAILDTTGKIVTVNAAWKRFAAENGADATVIGGTGVDYLAVCREAEASGDMSAGLAAEGIASVLCGREHQFSIEYPCDCPGQTRWFAMSVTALGSESLDGAVVLHFDITARRQNEMEISRQREMLSRESRLHSISELASGITHEMTQPLTAMSYYCDALQALLQRPEANTEDALALVTRLRGQLVRAMDVVTHLRSFMRRLYPELAVLSVNTVLNDASSLVETFARDRKCRLYLCISNDVPAIVGDHAQLKQVLMHLLHNAIEASASVADQVPWVRVTAVREADWVRISVQDNGPGMEGDPGEDIFKMMKTDVASRLGLGLSISLSIVKAHGGRLWLDTTCARGSCFHFTLPVAGEDHEI